MFAPRSKLWFTICALLFVVTSAVTGRPKEWSEREAVAEAQHDIRVHKIKFYWHGGYASMPVGVPAQYSYLPRRYPHADGGIGCIVTDQALRERQRKYSETYNKLMLSFLLQSQ
ncbi:MAG: hypothetical protein WBX14_03640 [Candidatus Udaeobacter sp.]